MAEALALLGLNGLAAPFCDGKNVLLSLLDGLAGLLCQLLQAHLGLPLIAAQTLNAEPSINSSAYMDPAHSQNYTILRVCS